jgi:hypothetical protein
VDTKSDDLRAESVLGGGICLHHLDSASKPRVSLTSLRKAFRQAFLA